MSTQTFALELLRATGMGLPSDFTGLGVVFYDRLDELPFLGLTVDSEIDIQLPVLGWMKIAKTLARAASLRSGWHDGFHFVNVKQEALTHLAQFVSPPLPVAATEVPMAAGARHMTAALATRVHGVLGVGIVTNRNEISYFSDGICVVSEKIR